MTKTILDALWSKIQSVFATKTDVANVSSSVTSLSTSVQTGLNTKVDKVSGKSLSTEDYTSAEKTKLNEIESGAQVNVKPDWAAASGTSAEILHKPIIPTVPTISTDIDADSTSDTKTASPKAVKTFVEGKGYLTQHQDISGKANKSEMSVVDGSDADADKTTITLKNGTSATVLKSHQSLSGKQDVIDSSHKLSADLVDDTNTTNKFTNATEKQTWNGKQDALVSGTNIKTINNESVLGSGNISVAAELPSNLAYTSNDNGEGIIPSDGIRAVTVTSAATMTISPDVVTIIDGTVGTAAITLQVPQDNLAHVWDILMTTDSTVAITFAMSNSATILYPDGFSVGASKAVEISVIGVGTKYYLRYGEFD